MSSLVVNGGIPQLNVSSSSQWMEIQRNTFKNWVNEQLKSGGQSIFDLRTDFADGVLLVALIEILQRRKLPGAVRNPAHNHEKLHNITLALDAIAKDNVTLINIDSSHITEGNTKLILALLWQLVLRYQIGLSNFQNRSWLLAWLQAVIPECHVTNLTSDWNSGIALHALLEFCKTGLSPDWKHLNPLDRVNNCRDAMKLARQHFGIPLVLRPEDLANSNLDELSAITYLSYFTKVGAPGYNATLQRIQPLVKNYPVFNFTTDWKDGRVLCELVHIFGGSIPSWPELKESNIERLNEGIDGATAIGVHPLLSAANIAEETSEHLGIMAYAARFLHFTPGVISYEHTYRDTKIVPLDESRTSTLHSSTHLINGNRSRASSPLSSASTINESQQQLEYTLVRTPSLRRKHRQRIGPTEGVKKDTYSDGVIIYATSHETVTPDDIRLEAESPTGRLIKMNGDGMYHAQFGSDEIGTWQVRLYINESLVDNCNIDVCDPSQVKVSGLRAGMAGNPHKFSIDCTNAGRGKLEVLVEKEGRNVLCNLRETHTDVYAASFNPVVAGHYKIALAYNKAEIRGIVNFSDIEGNDGPSQEELHRRAIFSTAMQQQRDHYKITAACDWQIDYMTGGPIDMYIGDTADVRVYSMQDGTVCNIPHLIADISNSSPGGTLKAEVQYGRHRFPADVIETDQPDIYKIVFTPKGPGTYNVWIIYDGHLAKGSPFIQEIAELTSPTAEGPGLIKGVVAEQSEFTIDARGFPGDVTIDVEGPHHPINSRVDTNPDNTHKVTYVPEEVGIHRVRIKLDGKDITGSPFHPKIVDPTRCHLSGEMQPYLERGERIPLMVNKEKHLPFDASRAGPGELTANVHGPSEKVPVTIDARGDGKHTLIFTPKEEGKHYIDVFWGGFALPRSPYLGYATPYQQDPEPFVHIRPTSPVHVRTEPVTRNDSYRRSEPPSGYWVRADNRPNSPDNGPHKVYILAPTKSEPSVPKATTIPPTRIRVHRHGSDISPINKQRYLQPKRTGSIYSGSSVSAKSEPKRKKEPDVMITRLPRVTPTYHYEPASMPDLYVYQTSPQSSSPPSVSPSYIYAKPQKSPPDNKGPNPKVVLRGKGLKEAELDKPATFTIDGRQAGPGKCEVRLENVSNLHKTGIVFQCGESKHVSFDDDDSGVVANGEPEVRVHSIRSEPPVQIKPTGPKQYQCTYTPKVPGAYLLDIKWNGKPFKCCPFKIDVKNPVYPEKVGVTGDIKTGVLGKDIDLKIDPREAGHGELTIDCKDPDGLDVPVHLTDNFDGTYRLKVNPEKLGKHILSIKLNKHHVFGSPFAIEIHPTAKHGKVKVWGPGLENGVFPEYQGHFFVDATGAGGGELHVSVMGLKG
ncbi:filamin-A-like isoform X3 [Ruditapes philippinarum]|uniref:filamin-A-like isoform X3 n=1 Tax=Ruditapes philippinarum TaxID=129788 RepID=UPI00295B575D|nr:filamin-A-like isoform X3 [Ruditapes philippinarum]